MTLPQLSFSLSAGAKRRDAGHSSILSHYSLEMIREVIREVASKREGFTSEDVSDALPQITRESLSLSPNALGAVFRAAAMANEIEDSGKMVHARRPEARARRIVIWRRKVA